MTAVLEELRSDNAARVIVITGAGDVFCAGMDLKEFFVALKDKPAEYEAVWRMAVEWRGRTLRYYPKPVIAMVNGFCFGGAFSIVEGCDLAFAAEDATSVCRKSTSSCSRAAACRNRSPICCVRATRFITACRATVSMASRRAHRLHQQGVSEGKTG